MKRVEDAMNTLIEHFDSVHIFATRNEPTENGTVQVSMGLGNWFARYGQIKHWVIAEEEVSREKVRQSP